MVSTLKRSNDVMPVEKSKVACTNWWRELLRCRMTLEVSSPDCIFSALVFTEGNT